MQQFVKMLFSPVAFAIGFLWPLAAQLLISTGVMAPGWQCWLIAALLVAPFAAMAQLRGSWIWIR